MAEGLPKTLLLAEDDADDRLFFRDFLKDRNDLKLLPAAENGLELTQLLDDIPDIKNLPDLIILDQNMPKQNGLQTLEKLKKSSRYADIPVMVYSTYATDVLRKDCIDNGAALLFPKPDNKSGYHKMIDAFFSAIGI